MNNQNSQNKQKRKETIPIDENRFQIIKMLLNGGEQHKKIAEYMRTSLATVQRIQGSDSFEEYKSILKAMYYKKVEKKEKEIAEANAPALAPAPAPIVQIQPQAPVLQDEKLHGGTLSANYRINQMYEMMKTQTETLKLISNKLAFIVDELTGVKPAKEG